VATSRMIMGNNLLGREVALITSFALGLEFRILIAVSISCLWPKVMKSLPSRCFHGSEEIVREA